MPIDDIALSRRCQIFAVPEVTPGTLAYPTAAHFICPAGNALLNQVPTYTDSQEMADTLDLLDQFPDVMPAAQWSFPMYLRMAGFGAAPQGDAVFKAIQGSLPAPATAAINAVSGIDAVMTTIPYDLAVGELPPAGVISIGTEKIRYAAKTATTLTSCIRGYAGTIAAIAADDAVITLVSQVYKQTTSPPTFSLWIKTDWFLQFCTGCTVNEADIAVTTKDAVTFTLKGEGMLMGIAGKGVLAAASAAGLFTIQVNTTDGLAGNTLYSVGARIQNLTTGATNGNSGFTILAINTTTNTITLDTAIPSGGWSLGDTITGFLPPATPIGTPVKSRDTTVKVGGVVGRIRSTTIKMSLPKTYIVDEIGAQHPEAFVPGQRKISTSMDAYFKSTEAMKFGMGFNATDTTLEFIFGVTPGYNLDVFLPRVRVTVPSIKQDKDTMALTIPAAALGSGAGENSLYLGLE